MNNIFFEFNSEDQSLLRSLGVELMVLFGSQAQKITSQGSDYDIGILLNPQVLNKSKKELYDQIYDLLESKINKLTNIDIVFFDQAPLELQFHASKFGIPLFEKDAGTFAGFRQDIMIRYADFAPLRTLFQKSTLERIS